MEDPRTTAARTHFDRWAETYERDTAAVWLRQIQGAALAELSLTADDVLLDIGCGTGAAVRDAAAVVRRAVGIDLSPGMIAEARTRARDELLDNVEFHELDVSGRLPFDDATFTAIVCTTAFHHFPQPRETIGEISRVLTGSGRIVIADANRRQPVVFVLDLALRVFQRSHAGFRSPAQLTRDLREVGFDNVSSRTTHWRSYAFVTAERAQTPRA